MIGCIVANGQGHDKFTLTVELYTVVYLYLQAWQLISEGWVTVLEVYINGGRFVLPLEWEPTGKVTVDDLFYHSTECEPTGVVTVDDLSYHSTECESIGVVTVDDLFYHSTE